MTQSTNVVDGEVELALMGRLKGGPIIMLADDIGK